MITTIKNISANLFTGISSERILVIFFYIAPFLLLFPALLWHLDLMPTLGDEAIRAVVALEFIFKDDYITPTLNSDLYFKKPPVFNWVLLLFFDLGGKATEFFIRLPAVFSLLIYAIIIFISQRKSLGDKWAFVSAFAFITFGRMLFYDSMLGHIDLLFSLTVYLALIFVWKFYEEGKDYLLFIVSYFLVAVAFLMKGFPAIVFLGCTFIGLLLYKREYKRFISIAHLLGVFTFLFLIGVYFYVYSLRNDVSDFFKTLWSESSKRTVLENSWWDSVSFFFYFPFEYLFQLMPWTLLVVMAIRKDLIAIIKRNPMATFSALVIVSNIMIYWLSPLTRPRYLFPLIPFGFHLLIYLYLAPGAEKQRKITNILFAITFFVFAIASLLPFVVKLPIHISYMPWKVIIIFSAIALLTILSFIYKSEQMILLISVLLIARLEFDAFVLPVRESESPEARDRASLLEAISKLDQEAVYFHRDLYLKTCITYYIEREKLQLVRRYYTKGNEAFYMHKNIERKIDLSDAVFIIEEYQLNKEGHKVVADFFTDNHHYYFVQSI